MNVVLFFVCFYMNMVLLFDFKIVLNFTQPCRLGSTKTSRSIVGHSTRVKKKPSYLSLICCSIVSFPLEQIHFMILPSPVNEFAYFGLLWPSSLCQLRHKASKLKIIIFGSV